ncbi:MAG: hypothetical protein ACOYJ8_00245 [Patescibacteria group bacterium]
MPKLRVSSQNRLLSGVVLGQKTVKLALFISLGLIFLMVGLFFVVYNKLPPQVPLFYSRPWGEAQLASPWLLLVLPALSFFISLLNFILSGLFFDRPFLVQVLMWASVVFSFLSFFTLFRIIVIII